MLLVHLHILSTGCYAGWKVSLVENRCILRNSTSVLFQDTSPSKGSLKHTLQSLGCPVDLGTLEKVMAKSLALPVAQGIWCMGSWDWMDHMGCSAVLLLMLLFIADRWHIKAFECCISFSVGRFWWGVSVGGLNPNLLLLHQDPGAKPCLAEGGVYLHSQEPTRANQKINSVSAVGFIYKHFFLFLQHLGQVSNSLFFLWFIFWSLFLPRKLNGWARVWYYLPLAVENVKGMPWQMPLLSCFIGKSISCQSHTNWWCILPGK